MMLKLTVDCTGVPEYCQCESEIDIFALRDYSIILHDESPTSPGTAYCEQQGQRAGTCENYRAEIRLPHIPYQQGCDECFRMRDRVDATLDRIEVIDVWPIVKAIKTSGDYYGSDHGSVNFSSQYT